MMPNNNSKLGTKMDRCLKKRLALAEGGASSKQLSATGLKMKMKQKRFRSLKDIYKETSCNIYTMKDVEKLSKETQSLKKDLVVDGKTNGDHQESSRKGKQLLNDEGIFNNKKVEKLSQFGKKLPFEESRQEVEKDNYFGNDSTIITSTSKGKEKLPQSKKDGQIILATESEVKVSKAKALPQSTNQKHDKTIGRTTEVRKMLPPKVQRHQAITLSDQVVPVVESDNERSEKGLWKLAPYLSKTTIPSAKVIDIFEDDDDKSGNNIQLMNNVDETTGGSSMQIDKEMLMNDKSIRALDKSPSTDPATQKVASNDDLLGPGVASPMSGISTNSHSSMIFNKNVEIQTQDKVSKTTFKSNSIQESTGPSSTSKRKVRLFGTDLDSDPMKIAKAVKTSVVTNTHGSEETGQIDDFLLGDLNTSSDGFINSEIGDQVADCSPEERDLLSGNGEYLGTTLTLGSADALPLVPEERDFLNSFGTHGASGSSPPPQEANMTSIMNNDRRRLMLGFIPPQASNCFTVSQRSSFAPYIRQQTSVRNNNPTPLLRPIPRRPGRPYDAITLNNPSTLILASSILPNPSSPSNSSRPADHMQVFYGDAYPIFLMELGLPAPWSTTGAP